MIPETVPDDQYQEDAELIKIHDGKYLFVTNEQIILIQDPQG